ncbi:MAG: NUDIX hydrolase [Betaproteobacteria bacterium]|nr:MAG: NUDIX hydrolase [Betaproteobacteria bacterium]
MSAWKPSVTVAAIIERDGRFLFVEEHADGRRVLNQPAGHLDPGESLVAACAREVMEETAHRFTPEALVGVYRWHHAARDVTFLRFAFRGRLEGVETGRALDPEIIALHWLTPGELAERAALHRSPLVQRCLEDFLAGRHFPLEVLSKDFS